MSGPFTTVHEKRIEVLNKVRHGLTGESTVITLLAVNEETGALDNELLKVDRLWTKRVIRDEPLASDEGDRAYTEAFEVAEKVLSAEIARRVVAVQHGKDRYSVETGGKPSGIQRYWRFKITSAEVVED